MAMNISLCTYNSNGLGAGRMSYVNDLSRNHHFVLVQEHWQYDEQICRFEKEIPNVNVHGVSEMEPAIPLVGRPFGGCCILWQKDLVGTVTPIPCDHKRMCCVLHDTGKVRLLIICVYMPCDDTSLDSAATYAEMISKLSEISQKYDVHSVIIGGDFNTSFMRKKSKNTKMLEKFMLEDDMKCCFNSIVSNTTFSYESKINGDRSLLDHFLVSDNTFYAITEYTSLQHGQNLSDHNAIRLVLDIDVNYVVLSDLDSVRAQSCDWAKATENQLELYKQQLNLQLSSIVLPVEALHCCDTNCSKHNQSLQAYHDAIISCCITSGTESIPLKGGVKVE